MTLYKNFAHAFKSFKIKVSEWFHAYFFNGYAKWLLFLSTVLSLGAFIGAINESQYLLAILSVIFGWLVLPFIGFMFIVFISWWALCFFIAEYFIQKIFLHKIEDMTSEKNIVNNIIHIDLLLKLKNKQYEIFYSKDNGYCILTKNPCQFVCYVADSGVKKIKKLLDI